MPDRDFTFATSVHDYKYDAPASGYIGPHSASGLVWNNAIMNVGTEFEGIEKTTQYSVIGNVIIGSGTATYHTSDANVGN